MFKYNLDQTVWYMMEGHICSAPILARMYVDNLHNDWCNNSEQMRVFLPFGFTEIRYGTCHGTVNEKDAFGSKSELVDYLSKE